MTPDQIRVACNIIVRLERVCPRLPLEEQMDTRRLLCDAYNVFQLDSVAERLPASNIIPLDEATAELVRQ